MAGRKPARQKARTRPSGAGAADDATLLPPRAGSGRFLDDYLLYLLARASSIASGEFHAHLRARRVPLPVWRVLAVLDGSDGLTVGELAAACLFKQPTMTRAIDRLEAEGLVTRRGGKADRRRVIVAATEKGRALVAGLIADAKAHEARVLAGYGAAEVRALKSALRRLIARRHRSAS